MRSADRPASLTRRILPAAALAGVSGLVLTQLDRPESSSATIIIPRTTTTTPRSTSTAPDAQTSTTIQPLDPDNGSTVAPTTQSPNSTVPAAPACTGNEITGPAVDTRWGPVQVSAVVSADRIVCSSDAPITPHDRRRSVAINDRAVPIINDEVATQGMNFDNVSGATVTSNGYRASLQAILDGL